MTQRIKKAALAQQLAFQAGVESPDENLWLLDGVLPVLPIPEVPPPASAGRLPFYAGNATTAVAGELGHVGLINSDDSFILWVKRIDIFGSYGARLVTLRREDAPVSLTGVTTSQARVTYSDAGPDITPAAQAVLTDTAAAARGDSLTGGGAIPAPNGEVTQIPMDFYLNNGCVWVCDTVVNQVVFAAFYGVIVPVIQTQPAG